MAASRAVYTAGCQSVSLGGTSISWRHRLWVGVTRHKRPIAVSPPLQSQLEAASASRPPAHAHPLTHSLTPSLCRPATRPPSQTFVKTVAYALAFPFFVYVVGKQQQVRHVVGRRSIDGWIDRSRRLVVWCQSAQWLRLCLLCRLPWFEGERACVVLRRKVWPNMSCHWACEQPHRRLAKSGEPWGMPPWSAMRHGHARADGGRRFLVCRRSHHTQHIQDKEKYQREPVEYL